MKRKTNSITKPSNLQLLKMNTDWSAVFTNIDPFALASIGASSALFLCVS
jgi:hypothetical protein